MQKFQITGIRKPGKILHPKMGVIILERIDDATAQQLYDDGCPYLMPTPEERVKKNPLEKPIKPSTPSYKKKNFEKKHFDDSSNE